MTGLALAGTMAFLLLALLGGLGLTRAIDLATTLAFQSVASGPLDVLVNGHTLIGQLVVTLPFSALLAVIARRRLGDHAWVGPLLILATGAIGLAFKLALPHPGPPEELSRSIWDPVAVRVQTPGSFPSGHLARLTFLSILVGGLFPSRVTWIAAMAFVAFTLFARVYIGDHWISDALGGLALGAAVAAVALAWMRATSTRR